MTGCIWSWCRVSMVRLGNGWQYMVIPGTEACLKKLREQCDGTDPDCKERKPRAGPVTKSV